jgi:hypothetical protein
MKSVQLTAAALAVAFGLAGCEATPTGTLDPSYFTALIKGDVEASYSGTGYFMTSHQRMPGRPGVPDFLILHSTDGRHGTAQTLQLFRSSVEIPPVGSYPIGADMDGIPFRVTYTRESGGVGEHFTARSGEVVIHEASAQRIAGSFRFEAVLTATCTYGRGSGTCSPTPVAEGSPVIEVEGVFEAAAGRPGRRPY